MKTNIKICGITRNSYAKAAANAGADYIGVIVDIKESPRNVSLKNAAEIIKSSPIPSVVLLEKNINDTIKAASILKPYAIQLIGEYTPIDIQYLKKHYIAKSGKPSVSQAQELMRPHICHCSSALIVTKKQALML